MHVSLTAEKLTEVGGLSITNSLLMTWVVIAAIGIFALIFRLRLREKPSGVQNVVEAAVEGFYGIVASVAENPQLTRKFFPAVFTIFIFVLLNNWAGLLPGVGSIGVEHAEAAAEELVVPESPIAEGFEEVVDAELESTDHVVDLGAETEPAAAEQVSAESAESESIVATEHSESAEAEHATHFVPIFRPGSADLSFTLALAVCAVGLVQFMGMRRLGVGKYIGKFLNFKNPVLFFVGILEIVSEFSKMISFSFRLFGNIFAGEVLLTVIIALAPIIAPMPFYGLEIFVGLVQALVFAMLTLVFFRMATAEAH